MDPARVNRHLSAIEDVKNRMNVIFSSLILFIDIPSAEFVQ